MEGITLEDYLRGMVGYNIPDNALMSIMVKRDIAPMSLVSDITNRERELCTADLYMWCASTPSVMGTVKDADGGWSHQEGGVQTTVSDKRHLRKMAKDIYRRYGEVVPSSMKMITRGMKVWH